MDGDGEGVGGLGRRWEKRLASTWREELMVRKEEEEKDAAGKFLNPFCCNTSESTTRGCRGEGGLEGWEGGEGGEGGRWGLDR